MYTIHPVRALTPCLLFLSLTLATLSGPAAAADATTDPSQLSLRHATLLRCSAAFALGAQRQAAGDAAAQAWPDLAERGREFFIRAGAELMDGAALSRDRLDQLIRNQARALSEPDALGAAMPDCLASLEASGL